MENPYNSFFEDKTSKNTETDSTEIIPSDFRKFISENNKKGKVGKLAKKALKCSKKDNKELKKHSKLLNLHTSQIEDLNKKCANLNSEVRKLRRKTYLDNLQRLANSESISERKQLLKEIMAVEDSRYEE